MSESQMDVERIVSEVIRRLIAMGVVVPNGNGDTCTESTGNELHLTDRVVSLAVIERRLDGVRRVTVEKKAVVTPAVRDELREKNVELVRV